MHLYRILVLMGRCAKRCTLDLVIMRSNPVSCSSPFLFSHHYSSSLFFFFTVLLSQIYADPQPHIFSIMYSQSHIHTFTIIYWIAALTSIKLDSKIQRSHIHKDSFKDSVQDKWNRKKNRNSSSDHPTATSSKYPRRHREAGLPLRCR
jgi:hypothetical protein